MPRVSIGYLGTWAVRTWVLSTSRYTRARRSHSSRPRSPVRHAGGACRPKSKSSSPCPTFTPAWARGFASLPPPPPSLPLLPPPAWALLGYGIVKSCLDLLASISMPKSSRIVEILGCASFRMPVPPPAQRSPAGDQAVVRPAAEEPHGPCGTNHSCFVFLFLLFISPPPWLYVSMRPFFPSRLPCCWRYQAFYDLE